MQLKQKIIIFLFLMIFLFISVSPALAHKVIVFAWVEGDTVFVESKFAGGRKVKEGKIIVSDPDKNQLLTGKTNDKGEFSFRIPKKTALTITLVAGMGHQGEWTIPAEEIDGIHTHPAESSLESNVNVAKEEEQKNRIATREPCTPGASADEIQAAVEKALDKKLKPMMKILAESQERKPTLVDIFGGIGYILGLMGIAAYVNFRRK